jgi:hypothetical protein
VNAVTLKPIFREQIDKAVMVLTDEATYYSSPRADFPAVHFTVQHNVGEYVRGRAHARGRRKIGIVSVGTQLAFARGGRVRSFAIVETPNELYAELHDRMLVVFAPETWPAWLGKDPADPRELKALLAPCPSAGITCWAISIRVVNVKNNDPSVISPGAKVRGFNLSDRPCHGNGRRERIGGLNTAFIRPQP